jgi:adenosylcobinamide-phosphate synthase
MRPRLNKWRDERDWMDQHQIEQLAARLIGASLGLLLDRALGEPPQGLHPVALFGRVMQRLEGRCWADARANGALYAGCGVALGLGSGVILESALNLGGSPVLGSVFSTATAVWLCSAGKSLADHARGVLEPLQRNDLHEARVQVSRMVSRETGNLDATGVARAAVESVAENTNDALVAPAFYGAFLGAPGALLHRALNTMDAMVGYKNPRYRRFGWTAARLDDLAGWVPSRLAAALVMTLVPRRAKEVFKAWREDASRHPSPNGGVTEAAFAGALGVQLGGVNTYEGRVEARASLGTGKPAEPNDIERASLLLDAVGASLSGLLALSGLALWVLQTRAKRGNVVGVEP